MNNCTTRMWRFSESAPTFRLLYTMRFGISMSLNLKCEVSAVVNVCSVSDEKAVSMLHLDENFL